MIARAPEADRQREAPPAPRGGARRWTWRRLHTWIGIGAALWLLVASATGVLLTFRGSLKNPEPTVPAALQDAPPRPPMELVAEAERRGGAPAAELYFSTAPEEPVCVVLADDRGTEFYFTPGGVLLEIRYGDERGLTGFLFDLHTGVVLGRPGELLMALAGLGLLFLLISGVVIWPWRLRRAREAERAGRRP